MKSIYYLLIFLVFLFAFMLISIFLDSQAPEPIDFSDRFDRLARGIANSTLDLCFRWGGQWLTDGNTLITRDFEIPLENGLFAKGQAIMCVKQ